MWNDLNMSQRAEIISLAVKSGIRDMKSIRDLYNSSTYMPHRYDVGGNLITYPLVDAKEEGLDTWFKNNPYATGMAIGAGSNGIIGPRRIVRNPYSEILPWKHDPRWKGLDKIEAVRHYMDEINYKPEFMLSPKQRELQNTSPEKGGVKGTFYETDDNAFKQSIISRIIVGDYENLGVTPEQLEEYNTKFKDKFTEPTWGKKFAEGGNKETPINYTHRRFPITETLDVHPYMDTKFTPRDVGDFGDIEYMNAENDVLPYYNNYQKPDSLKGKSVVVYNDRLGSNTNEAVALDVLTHGLREQDSTWKNLYLPSLYEAFVDDANYYADRDNIPNEYKGEFVNSFIDGKIRDMVVKDNLRKQLNYQSKENWVNEYNQSTPDQQRVLSEAYKYIFPTQLPEVTITGKKKK